MSASLGPIHVKMYDKVLYQDAMAEALLTFAEEQGWAGGLRQLADSEAPAAAREDLRDIIDPDNIHGWLNAAVGASEKRFAFIVRGILSGHGERIGQLQGVIKSIGRDARLPDLSDAESAYRAVHDILLDGMPCDFPFRITDSSAEAVEWDIVTCPHAPYWQGEDNHAEAYYTLRGAWIEGALEHTGIAYARSPEGHTSLRREG